MTIDINGRRRYVFVRTAARKEPAIKKIILYSPAFTIPNSAVREIRPAVLSGGG